LREKPPWNMREEENTNHYSSLFISHYLSITHIITTRETRRHLYCIWGAVVGIFFYCVDIFRWRRSMFVNFLNYDCLFSNLSGGKDTLLHPVFEGEHTAAS
jgi:hypothetical protein